LIAVLLFDDVGAGIGAGFEERVEEAIGFVFAHDFAELGEEAFELLFVAWVYEDGF
jgi:hypothetical protein